MSDLRSVPIGAVIQALGGPEVKGGRIKAWWRDGDGLNVAVDAAKGQWFDHARGEGGGVLSLIKSVRLTDNAGALAWLTEQGFIEDRPRPSSKRNTAPTAGPIVAAYIYRDETGEPLYRVTRHEPKDFRQWRPDGRGGWLPGVKGVRLVPYRLRELLEAAIVFVVEGEKDAESLRDMGFCATCNARGAGKWRSEYNRYFRGKTVVIVPDRDEPGWAHARHVAKELKPVAAEVIELDLETEKDISDWFAAGHSEVELIATLEAYWAQKEGAHRG